jgi:hypothetical protein
LGVERKRKERKKRKRGRKMGKEKEGHGWMMLSRFENGGWADLKI